MPKKQNRLAFMQNLDIKKKAPQSANSSGAIAESVAAALSEFFMQCSIRCETIKNFMCGSQLLVPEPKTSYPVGVFCRKDFPHLPMPLRVREYLSMRTILFMCFHMVGRGWFPDSLSRAIKSTGQVNTGGSVEPQADSMLMGAYRKGSYCP